MKSDRPPKQTDMVVARSGDSMQTSSVSAGTAMAQPPNQGAIARSIESKAVTEVQASMLLAKRFPRDESASRDKILNACARQSLAERAVFSYARGGNEITGPSIRLAEEIARHWGNIDFGWRTVEVSYDSSTIEAFAFDLESNVRRTITFACSHMRHTKKGDYLLTDPRDVYENQANQASRRVRACVLALIPGDIVDDAITQCDETLRTKIDITPDRIKAIVASFAEMGVSVGQIEKRIQRRIESIQPAHVVQLSKIRNSIREGMSEVSAWFEAEDKPAETQPKQEKGVAGLQAVLDSAKKEK